jgi:acyl-coenzyme A synthetase/AMP-(fatty) acid ligase
MRALALQPDAADYYANGYWREGDMWSDFEALVAAHPGKVALRVGERAITYAELARSAVALSARLADSGVERGDVVILLGRNSIVAAAALLACVHRGAVAAPLPPMFGAAQLSALITQTGAKALVGFGGEAEIAKCEHAAGEVPCLIALRDEVIDELAAAGEQAAPHEAVDLGAEGHHALDQHAAVRHRAAARPLGADE